jgi:hypothetical protein
MPKQTRANDNLEQQHTTRRKAQQGPGAQTTAANAGSAGSHLQRLPDNPAAATPADVSQMQKNYGNRAVTRLLSSHTVQAKLEVGPADDHYEQEADRVAQTVMRMPEKDEEEKAEG